MTKSIAFLGAGLMGTPMILSLLRCGFSVRVWNRSAEKAEALVPHGADAFPTAVAAVTGADMVITMLSDGTVTNAMVLDPEISRAMRRGMIWIDMSSTKPVEARVQFEHLAKHEVAHLDAPVSGGVRGAEEASLAIMVGGDLEAFNGAASVFDAMGRAVHVGPPGSGQLAKLANQAIVATTIGAVAEAMLFLEKTGADPAAVRAALKGGFADSTILQMHGVRMTNGDFEPGGLARLQLKDLDNAMEEAQQVGLSLPLAEDVQRRFHRLVHELNGGGLDHAALYLELCALNDV